MHGRPRGLQGIAWDKIPGQTFGTGIGISVQSSDNQVCLSGQSEIVSKISTRNSYMWIGPDYLGAILPIVLDLVLTTIIYMYIVRYA